MRKKKRNLNILIKDANLIRWPIRNHSKLAFSTGENGCKDASWVMDMPFTFGIEEVFLNGAVYIYEDTGELIWYGRVESIQAQEQGGNPQVVVTATGGWSALYDTYATGSYGPATPEGIIGALLTGYFDVTGVLTTGLTSLTYQTPNKGTDSIRLGQAILEVCSMGTLTAGVRVVPQVWEEHQLITKNLPVTPVAAYSVSKSNLAAVSISRNLSSIYNRVRYRYKSSTDQTLQQTLSDDTTGQTQLGNYYNTPPTFHSFLRSLIQDITSDADMSSSTAQNYSDAALASTKLIRGEPTNITLSRNWVVRDETGLQEINNYNVRAGNWLIIRDLYGHPTDYTDQSTVQNPGSENVQLMVYISETRYEDETETLTLTPGAGSGLGNNDGVV